MLKKQLDTFSDMISNRERSWVKINIQNRDIDGIYIENNNKTLKVDIVNMEDV